MGKLESLEKLRKYELFHRGIQVSAYMPSDELADEIQAEVDERYMLLPVDADGVPIHVGDSIEYPNGSHDVVRFITVNDNVPTFNESGWIASKCRHVKPRTVRDVLNDMARDIYEDAGSVMFDADFIIDKYAAELQMRGDAEC